MTSHAEYARVCFRILQILNLAFAVSTSKAACAEGLIACENREVFNFVPASRTAVSTVVADERPVSQQQ